MVHIYYSNAELYHKMSLKQLWYTVVVQNDSWGLKCFIHTFWVGFEHAVYYETEKHLIVF